MKRVTLAVAGPALAILAACTFASGTAWAADGTRILAVAWNDPAQGQGFVRGLSAQPPWQFVTPVLGVGRDTVLRAAFGRLFAVSTADDRITVIDPQSWTILRRYDLRAGAQPTDIALARPGRAYVARRNATHLARLDLATGALSDVVDLSGFAPPGESLPDLAMMERWQDRLFVQIRRFNIRPAMIAAVDLASETLLDADPGTPEPDAITLDGRAPRFKMQPLDGRLLVSATGGFFDGGGIEALDPQALVSEGLLLREAGGQVGADLGAFRMLSGQHGFLTYSTDLLLSSHLNPFRFGINVGPELHVSLSYFVPVLLYDRAQNRIFYPEGDANRPGVHVFDAATGERLTRDPRPTGGPPTDLEWVDRVATDRWH